MPQPGDPEGCDDANEWHLMAQQSVRAYYLLTIWAQENKRLDSTDLKIVHQILMSGGLDSAGRFRDHGDVHPRNPCPRNVGKI